MDPGPSIIVRPLSEADRRVAGRIYARAFDRLMHSMLRADADLAGDLMAEALRPSPNIWVAELDGVVAGLAWVQDTLLPVAGESTWKLLRGHLSRRDAARACVFDAMLHGVSIDPDRLYLDSLAVDPRYEGRGVGRSLLRHVVDEAGRRHKAAVCLYVIDRDRRARAIYERFGLVTLRSESPRFFKSVIGFSRTDYMELTLDDGHTASRADGGSDTKRATPLRTRPLELFEALVWRRLD